MDFKDIIYSRYSCRDFKETPIAEDDLHFILEAGRLAPSAQNRQPWRYIVITDKDIIKKLAFHSIVGTINFFIKDAPLIIVACADTNTSLKFNNQDYYLVDTAISFHQMMLTAHSLGIESCWLAAFDEKQVKKIFNLPENIRIIGLSPFGYPKENKSFYGKTVSFFAQSKKRKSKSEIFSFNKWSFNKSKEEK